ncbi:MAG: hypothetical protein P4L65_03745 [Legionella sp.]|nr:hypothetical protein [Legionella sp.]
MSAEPGDDVTVSPSTPKSVAPSTKPAPDPLAPSVEKSKAVVPGDEPKKKIKPDDDDDNKKDHAADNEPLPQLHAPKKDKQQHKDPMMELVDDLNAFVSETNQEIGDYIVKKGKQAWSAFKETGPGKEIDKALDEAKSGINKVRDAMNDRMDAGKQAIATSVSNSFASLKGKVANAFSKAKEIPASPQVQDTTAKEIPASPQVQDAAAKESPASPQVQDAAAKESPATPQAQDVVAKEEVSLSAPADSAPSETNDLVAAFGDMDFDGLVADNQAVPEAPAPKAPVPAAPSPEANASEEGENQRLGKK